MARSFQLLPLLFLFTLAACSGTRPIAEPPPLTPPVAEDTVTVPAETLEDPLVDWLSLDEATDLRRGISLKKAYETVLKNKTPQRTVVVAVLDSGIDIEHEDLRDNIWVNEDEVPGNALDDDGNGYVDDVNGWNFIGGPNGENVAYDTYEVTRELVRLRPLYQDADPDTLTPAQQQEQTYYRQLEETYAEKVAEYQLYEQQIGQVNKVVQDAAQKLRAFLNTDDLTEEAIAAIGQDAPADVQQAAGVMRYIFAQGFGPEDIQKQMEQIEAALRYGYNAEFDPRPIVGDNYADVNERYYGNNDVEGPDPSHGTHVAGIIGAVRDNAVGIDGIAPHVEIMSVRTVPDGDERDKDVANAIRYAVDNGAHIINMSFGKDYSPQKEAVDEAVRYAAEKGVLLIHGAGNDAQDVDLGNNFPTPRLGSDQERASNWIEVGATAWGTEDAFVAPFSNYGQQYVDVFAPGVQIYSTTPDDTYAFFDGTSMAAPVVAGIAALLMAYYPDLTAAQVKQIIVESAVRFPGERVLLPGSEDERVEFARLSGTGGLVNAYGAILLAESMRN